jgi:hypothetical protein
MNKILLAMMLFTVGAGAFHAAHRHSAQLQQKVQAAHESWQIHTQQLADARSEQAGLTERIRELKQTLAQSRPGAGSALWSALQTNRADRLPRELRRQTLAELGFDWRTSPDFVVVSKRTVRDVQMLALRDGQVTEAAVGVLALTAGERAQIATACERVKPISRPGWWRIWSARNRPVKFWRTTPCPKIPNCRRPSPTPSPPL